MGDQQFGREFSERLIGLIGARIRLEERRVDGGPYLPLASASDGGDAGFLRLWIATDDSLIDRLVHFRLQSAPVDTHLLFLFGRTDTAMPHFHGQVVQFSPDTCVYNADIIPRLDAVDHPEYFREVYGPLTETYRKVTGNRDNVSALAPGNPAVTAYLSPWGIGAGRPAGRAELARVAPAIEAYVAHCLDLAHGFRYGGMRPDALRDRDRRHMALFHSDELDPRAWKGVYRVLGEPVGRRVKEIFATPIR